MQIIELQDRVDFDEWRGHARRLLAAAVAPEDVSWSLAGEGSLFGLDEAAMTTAPAAPATVPRAFVGMAQAVLAHSDPQRHALLYRLLWRLTRGERDLLQRLTDSDMARAQVLVKSVGRDSHKMKAFVRFRERPAEVGGKPVYLSWFEPEHFIVERVAPFFVRRFAGMHWSILTPYRSAHWNGEQLQFGAGASRRDAAGDDALEGLWRTYYANIFNPARLKISAMKSEMPMKYWKNLPEAQLIPALIREARPRLHEMVEAQPTTPRKRVPAPVLGHASIEPQPPGTLADLRRQARDCRRCALWEPATQTVFGEGPDTARLVLIGEQPGDHEDLAGRPFIGPAGKLLDRALAEAGLDRAQLYLTNAVKHFKFSVTRTPRGKTRLHQRADAGEQAACRPWLAAELLRLRPRVIVCLGALSANAVFGADFKLLAQRGQWHRLDDSTQALATVHPAYVLRLRDETARAEAYGWLVCDLRLAAQALAESGALHQPSAS